MTTDAATETRLLAEHPRQIAHMWSRIDQSRFGLVFGAGTSKKCDLPDWPELIERIAHDRNVKGEALLADQTGKQASSITQTLFQHFVARTLKRTGSISQGTIRRAWMDVIRKQLYKKARKAVSRYYDEHPYISQYVPLVKRIPMTVTYNFDDFLERFLVEEGKRNGGPDAQGKPYEVLWRPDVHPRRAHGVIRISVSPL